MEADWEAQIGPDEPTIVAPWEGFTDLRLHPDSAHALPETATSPELAEELILLNAPASPVFTSKCDLWPLESEDIDPREFDFLEFDVDRTATPAGTARGLAAYIDVIPAGPARRATFSAVEQMARAIVQRLRGQNSSQPGRIDLVLRPARVEGESGYAFTLYASAIGATESAARAHFRAVLHAAVVATMEEAARAGE